MMFHTRWGRRLRPWAFASGALLGLAPGQGFTPVREVRSESELFDLVFQSPPGPVMDLAARLPVVDDFSTAQRDAYRGKEADLALMAVESGALKLPYQKGTHVYERKDRTLAPGEAVTALFSFPPKGVPEYRAGIQVGDYPFTLLGRGMVVMVDPRKAEWDLYGPKPEKETRLVLIRGTGGAASVIRWEVEGSGLLGNGTFTATNLPERAPISLFINHNYKKETGTIRICDFRAGPFTAAPPPKRVSPHYQPWLARMDRSEAEWAAPKAALTLDPGPALTRTEREALVRHALEVPFVGNNEGNNLIYGSSYNADKTVAIAYGLSGDRALLSRLLRFAEETLASRNDPATGYVVSGGRRAMVWPHYLSTRLVGRERQVVVELSEGLMRNIPRTARIILENPAVWQERLGPGSNETCRETAIRYLRESHRSLDDYFLKYFLDRKTLRPTYPLEDPKPEDFLDNPSWAGRTPPWNRQWFVLTALVDLVACHRILGTEPERVALYGGILRASIAQWREEARVVEAQGKSCLTWPYMSTTDWKQAEDRNHGSYDLEFLWHAWEAGGYGLTAETMANIGHAILYLMHKGDGKFSASMNGAGAVGTFKDHDLNNYIPFGQVCPELIPIFRQNIDGEPSKVAVNLAQFLRLKHIRSGQKTPCW